MDPATHYILVKVQKSDDNVNYSPIYDVPGILKEVSPSSFIPRVVSIGPLHKGLVNLRSVQRRKPTALKELLRKVTREYLQEIGGEQVTLEQILDNCTKKVREWIPEIKRSYSGMKENITEDKLVQMMVMDGCYILQFIDKLPVTGNSFSDNRLRSRNIALDLVLLENQIPFFVLQDLYDLTLGRLQPQSTLTDMLMVLLDLINPFTEPLNIRVENEGTENPTYHHILDLLHKSYKPNFDLPEIKEIPAAHSAVDLDKVGVTVKPNRNPIWPMAMEFEYSFYSLKSTLRMPIVRIDNFFEVVLRNLIAYEQYSRVENYVTSYAMAMHMIAATSADIAMMQNSGVIISHLGSNEKASDMISSICKNVNLQDFYYIESWKKANNHYIGYWSKYIGVLKKNYLSTPWKAIALVVGIIVFLITIARFVLQIITFASKH